MQTQPLYKYLIEPPKKSSLPKAKEVSTETGFHSNVQQPKKGSDDDWKGILTTVICFLLYLFLALHQRDSIERETRWMEKHGYSDEQIQQTLEDEYSDSEPSLENYSPE